MKRRIKRWSTGNKWHRHGSRLYRRIWDMKFRNKIRLLTVSAGLLPVLLLSVYMQGKMVALLRTREMNTMTRALQQAVDSVSNRAEIYKNLINYLSYSQELRSVLARTENGEPEAGMMTDMERYRQYVDVIDPLLKMPQLYHKEIKGITLYAQNIEIAHGSMLVPFGNAAAEPWYQRIEPGSRKVVWYVRDRGKREITAIRPFSGDESMRALLAIRIDYDALMEPIRLLSHDDTHVMLVNEEGELVYSSENIVFHGRDKAEYTMKSIRRKYAFVEASIRDTGWTCIVYRPEASVTGAARRIAMGNIPIIVIGIGLLVAAGSYFSKRTVSDLEMLTENMNRVHMGVREVTVSSTSKDEVGVLIRSFSRMMTQINYLINEVYEGRIQLVHTEIKALQAQINPHFLYNSLSIINWKALEAGEEEISRVTLALSTYYRTSLNRGETMTTVEKEIQNIRAYLQIQLVMHDGNFSVEEVLDETLFHYEIPKLILQPIVENAIEHGLDPSEKQEKMIRIRLFSQDDRICFDISDNGKGMSAGIAERILTYESGGYGMRNVAQRIRLTYSDRAQIYVESCEESRGTDGKSGTTVHMCMPKYAPNQRKDTGEGA